MYKEDFTERDIPYEILEQHGLTHEMIDDLPQSVMNKLLHGEFTPLLPITMKTDMGNWQYPSRIALKSTGNGVKVVLKPKIETSSIGLYSPDQQDLLKQGKAIIGQRPKDLRNNENTGKYFIQYDEDTNQVLSVPTSFVGENIRVISDMFGLDYDIIKNLQQGEAQTVEWSDEELNNEVQMLTFGIDLRSDLGVRLAVGDIQEWFGSILGQAAGLTFFLGVITQVLQEECFTGLQGIGLGLGFLAVVGELDGNAQAFADAAHDVLEAELGIHFLGAAQVGHDDEGTTFCEHLLEGGHGPADAGVVRDLEVFVEGNIEVYAYDGLFAFEIVLVNKLLHGV